MLKRLLSLLLGKFYSKQESELVGHQAMPSPSNTLITPSIKTECTTWSDAHIGIAPADGYLYVTGRTTNTDGFLQISSDTTEIAATTFGNTDKDIRLLFPFAKGQMMKVTAKSLKNIFLRFSSSIGGGISALKNALLQGGAICLSNLCSSLRRSSLQARRSGYRTSETRIIQKVSPCLCLTKGTISSMSHHVMGCLSWRKAAQARCTLSATAETIGSTLIRNILTPIIKDYLCKLIRAKQYLIKPRPITEAASAVVNSSLLCQDLNKLEGGASC